MGGYRTAHRAPNRAASVEGGHRSQLVGILAVVFLLAGLALGTYTVLIPALLGLVLTTATWRFVAMRLNPFSVGFYLPVKPSWLAIGTVAVCGSLLLGLAWSMWRSGLGPIVPGHAP